MVSSFFKGLWGFLRLLLRMPKGRSVVSNAGAKRVRQAMHVTGATGQGFSGTSRTDKFLAKELRDGHQQDRQVSGQRARRRA